MNRKLLSVAVLLASSSLAPAAPGFSVWDGGDGDWDTHFLNWDGGHKWVTNGNALFGGASGTVTLAQDIRARIVRFSADGYVIDGAFPLDIKDGVLLDAGVTSASILAPVLLSKDKSWTVADAGAALTVSSVNLAGHDLAISGAGDVVMTSGFSGTGSVSKSGAGTLWLSGSSSHVGPTSVTDGSIKVTGSATSSPITVSVEGRITGDGAVGTLVIADGGILSPGLGVGTLTAGNVTWQGGGYYNWQVADAVGGAGVGHDQLVSGGSLTIEATPLSRFKINLWSLAGAVDGAPANFDPAQAYSWDIAAFASIVGFDAARFLIVRGPSEGTGGFLPAAGGAFSVVSDGLRITLLYTPAAEPVWIDATGVWSDGTRWQGGAPPSEGAAIVYAGSGGVSTNDSHLSSVAGIRFSSDAAGAYVVAGSALSLGAAGVVNDSAHVQTVAADLVLATNSQLVTHTAALVVSGDIDTGVYTLVVDGDHDTLVSGALLGDGAVYKLDHGRLTLSGASRLSGGVEAAVGDLVVDGGFAGPIRIGRRALLGGVGSLEGTVEVAGALAPGRSPGILTQSAGDTTLLTGSRFVAEIGGTRPGSGDGHHDRYDILAGRCVIQVGVTLEARGWDAAPGVPFLTSRGDVMTLIRAMGGIVDVFDDLANPVRAERVIFDNDTVHSHRYGNLYGTGLTGSQTLAAYAATPAQAAYAEALERAAVTPSPSSTADHPAAFIDGSTTEGRVVLAVLRGEDLDAYSPEAYLGATDHALASLRAASESFLPGASPRVRPGDWTFSLGRDEVRRGRDGGSGPAFDRDHVASNTTLGASCELGPDLLLGLFVAANDGRFTSRHARVEVDGTMHGAVLIRRLPGPRSASVRLSLAWADLALDSDRRAPLGSSGDGEILLSNAGSSARNVPLDAFVARLSASARLAGSDELSLDGTLGVLHGRSTVAAFAESGDGANLGVAVRPDETSILSLGLTGSVLLSPGTDLAFTLGYERELGDPSVGLDATLSGEAFSLVDGTAERDTFLVGAGLSQELAGDVTFRLGAELRLNGSLHHDERFHLSISKRF